ncbi:type II toxin-antitoxin system PemK/MazF family toxin [Neorhizobium lilium]|uniref:Type II toxin-antitoxin system PemK/MazF family toxin n=1 Tax=Neorhizobium lilium TaxID=2503024 RepID=A0A3S3SFL7_9HYPH|nr:type II toxin-antitoxin system PemK/MazF family toxin [Neorhizobium lilium]RWX79141.1 type II toxin-antitoxin system PemK/MazF family toxin [Neorhizobium lilium]
MRRGDIVILAAPGDYGKPRPAVIILADELIDEHASMSFCQFTTTLISDADYRVDVEPSETNGLRIFSQIMADKPLTMARHRIGSVIGRLNDADLHRLNIALAFALGL